jgi:hypothetical protein
VTIIMGDGDPASNLKAARAVTMQSNIVAKKL